MSFLSDYLGTAYKEGMTEDELSAAIEKIVKKSDANMANLKNLLSRANSDVKKYKDEAHEGKSKEAVELANAKEALAKAEQENKDLQRTISLSTRTNELLAQGYTADLAASTAAALVDGDIDTVLKNQKAYAEQLEKTVQDKLLRGTPYPVSGGSAAPVIDYAKKISEANDAGRFAEAAYYTRLQAQAEADKNGG